MLLAPPPPPVLLTGAQVWVDGEPQLTLQREPAITPLELRLPFGPHRITFRLATYQEQTIEIDVTKKKMEPRQIRLEANPGRLVVRVPSEYRQASLKNRDCQF